ncbi:MAG: aromatic-ring-hydroxylating dioxygenase subunit beta [Pseudomonadota bacterium]
MTGAAALALQDIGADLLRQEAASLDERRWDDWLALFSAQCEYWMPTWRTEEQLTEDPQSEMSHIYYASRAGLEDRIMRIRSRRSPASTPMPRTAHSIGYVRMIDGPAVGDGHFSLQSSWSCNVFYPFLKRTETFFGLAYYTLVREDDQWRIGKKKIVLLNDYIPSMLDIYCV